MKCIKVAAIVKAAELMNRCFSISGVLHIYTCRQLDMLKVWYCHKVGIYLYFICMYIGKHVLTKVYVVVYSIFACILKFFFNILHKTLSKQFLLRQREGNDGKKWEWQKYILFFFKITICYDDRHYVIFFT